MSSSESIRNTTSINHVGHCVNDLERSRAFFENVFDFQFWWQFDAPDQICSVLLDIPEPLGLQAISMIKDGFVIELLHYSDADTLAVPKRVMNEPGLTHLSVGVSDLDATLAKVVEYGGEVLEHTRVSISEGSKAAFVRDPDGMLIEVSNMHPDGDPRPPKPTPQ